MKILVGYPPLKSKKGTPLLSQNRQFQYFSNPTYIYPVIPATAATLLKQNGYEVVWLDCIVEGIDLLDFFRFIQNEKPDVLAFETKTPVIKEHWQIINLLKERFPKIRLVMFGDHVTARPEESLLMSKVDYIITGGDFDFSLLGLCNFINGKGKMPKGIWYRKNGIVKNNGKFELKHNLNELPFADRELTKWWLYQKEYNMKFKPYAYIMSGRDCWWGKCSFCAWPQIFPKFRVRSVNNVLDEIGMLIEKYGVKEIFDDSGTLMVGKWLNELCNGLIERGYNTKIKYSCNMRFGCLSEEDYKLMKSAGFRLLKFGLESANQDTLDRLNKNIKVSDIVEGCKLARAAGLEVHLTMIVGYPWETKEDAFNTLRLAKKLMKDGDAHVLQATVIVPYPGTKLFGEAVKNNWFKFDPKEYERYDMSEPVLKTLMSEKEVMNICGGIYMIFLSPRYMLHQLSRIKSLKELKYTLSGVKAVVGHLRDFVR